MSANIYTMITRLQVKNYRSLADVDLTLGPLTVLVGQNGAGKTNLIDSLCFVRDALVYGPGTAIAERRGMAIRQVPTKPINHASIHLHLQGSEWSGEYGFAFTEKDAEYSVKWEKCSIRKDALDEADFGTITLETKNGEWVHLPKQIEQSLPSKTSSINNRTLMLPALSQLVPSANLVYQFLSNMGFYDIYSTSALSRQRPASPYPLDEEGQNLAAVLKHLKAKNSYEFSSLLEALRKSVPYIDNYSVVQMGGDLVIQLQHIASEGSIGGSTFELGVESAGTRRILFILAALYQDSPRSLLAIEEPSANIDTRAVEVLSDVLREASLRSQVVITTHSSDLIDSFLVETLRVLDYDVDNLATQVGPVSRSQQAAITDQLFTVGELMRSEGLRRETLEPVVG